jgi:hypothetical protein
MPTGLQIAMVSSSDIRKSCFSFNAVFGIIYAFRAAGVLPSHHFASVRLHISVLEALLTPCDSQVIEVAVSGHSLNHSGVRPALLLAPAFSP